MNKNAQQEFRIYLISDATGTTLQGLARAALSQFDGIEPAERFWPMIRSEIQLNRAIADVKKAPGPVLFTLVDKKLRRKLQKECADLNIPCMPVLDPILKSMSSYLGLEAKGIPGLQHSLNEAYFERIDAIDFALNFDDGRTTEGLEDADVILLGVSRTSKTPTCIFLARKGIKAANIPLVPYREVPEKVFKFKKPLIIGLTESPKRLESLRRSRLHAEDSDGYDENEYLDIDKIEEEVRNARKLFTKYKIPVIDVTKKSVEETTAEIYAILQRHKGKLAKKEVDNV